jgi:hypothetical protein
MPTVAISDGFLDAFAAIPKAQQRKVREFTEKFRRNPTAASSTMKRFAVRRTNEFARSGLAATIGQ